MRAEVAALKATCFAPAPAGGKAMMETAAAPARDRSLLIVEDDKPFVARLARAMEARGFTVTTAESVADGLQHVEHRAPAYAVVDMRLGDGSGLDVISALKRKRADAP